MLAPTLTSALRAPVLRVSSRQPSSSRRGPVMIRADCSPELRKNVNRAMVAPRALSSYSPVEQMMYELEEQMNSVTRAFGLPTLASPWEQSQSAATTNLRALAVDVLDKGDHFELAADVPGMTDKDIQVIVSPDKVLQISGERKVEKEEGKEGEGLWRIERSYGSFVRRFRLPDNVDPEGIKAIVKDGVLSLSVPKVEEPQPKAIHIKVVSMAGPVSKNSESAGPAAADSVAAGETATENENAGEKAATDA